MKKIHPDYEVYELEKPKTSKFKRGVYRVFWVFAFITAVIWVIEGFQFLAVKQPLYMLGAFAFTIEAVSWVIKGFKSN